MILILRDGRLHKAQADRRADTPNLGVVKPFAVFGLELLQPIDHLCDRGWERVLAVGGQPLQALELDRGALFDGIHRSSNFGAKTFGLLTDQTTMISCERAKIGCVEQLLQPVKLFLWQFSFDPLARWEKILGQQSIWIEGVVLGRSNSTCADKPEIPIARNGKTDMANSSGFHNRRATIGKPRQNIVVRRMVDFLCECRAGDENGGCHRQEHRVWLHGRASCEERVALIVAQSCGARQAGYLCFFGPAAFTSGGTSNFSKFLTKRLRKSSAPLS